MECINLPRGPGWRKFVIRGPPPAAMLFSYLDDNLTIGAQVANLLVHGQEAERPLPICRALVSPALPAGGDCLKFIKRP